MHYTSEVHVSSRRNQVSETQQRATRVSGGAQTANGEQQEQPKRRRTRSPSVSKPAFVVMQILDEQGQPHAFDKKRVKVLAVERDAGKVLEAIDAGDYTDAFYLRIVVPASTRAGSPNKTTTA
jgi:hypothetical protein